MERPYSCRWVAHTSYQSLVPLINLRGEAIFTQVGSVAHTSYQSLGPLINLHGEAIFMQVGSTHQLPELGTRQLSSLASRQRDEASATDFWSRSRNIVFSNIQSF